MKICIEDDENSSHEDCEILDELRTLEDLLLRIIELLEEPQIDQVAVVDSGVASVG